MDQLNLNLIKKNDFFLMEPTIGRFNQQFYLATANGFNIASYYYYDLSKNPFKKLNLILKMINQT